MHNYRRYRKYEHSIWHWLKKRKLFILLFCVIGLFLVTSQVLFPQINTFFSSKSETPKQITKTTTPPTTTPNQTTDSSSRFSKITAHEAAHRIPVLMYHDVQDIQKTTNTNVMPTTTFEAQLKWLKENNYTTITAEEFIDAYQGKISLPKNSVLITLDDGFKSIKTIVNPLLKKYNMNAVSFIIGSYKERAKWHLTEAEIQEIAQDKHITFESHTYDLHKDGKHRGIINETPIDEIVSDNQKNEQVIQHKTNMFCYPFGAFSENAIKGLKKANVPFAFAIKSGKATWVELNKTKTSPFGDVQDPLALPRVRIDGNISIDTFKDLLTDTIKE